MSQPKDLKPISVKAPLHLLPARATRAGIAAIEHGALKYEPWNWQDSSRNEERINELLAALMRHATAAADPAESDRDDESGLHHIAHAWACCTIIMHKLGLDYEPSKLKVPVEEMTAAVMRAVATEDGRSFRPEMPRCYEVPRHEPEEPETDR